MAFIDQVTPILALHLGSKFNIVRVQEYGGRGAIVEVECGDLNIRLIHDRALDFYADVAVPHDPTKWHELVYLLVLASGEPPEDVDTSVGHTLADLSEFVRQFALHFEKIRMLLSSEQVAETERRAGEIRLRKMDPTIRKLMK
jgi:hypothetical protein